LRKGLGTNKEVLTINGKVKVLRGHHRMIIFKKLFGTFVAEKAMKSRQGDRN
jgi:hypothetical protein